MSSKIAEGFPFLYMCGFLMIRMCLEREREELPSNRPVTIIAKKDKERIIPITILLLL